MPLLSHRRLKYIFLTLAIPVVNSFSRLSSMSASSAILKTEPLRPQNSVLDPFLFCVYHKDMYPPGNDRMESPRRGNGMDFNPDAPYRMYHGDKYPGFPQVYLLLPESLIVLLCSYFYAVCE